MKIIRLAVERPVTTAMFYAAIVLIGLISLFILPRELFPTVSFPELLVVTHYGAAAPEEIENIITKIVEEQTGTVPNLRRVRSISREGLSVVILEFNWGSDIGLAHLNVREKIDLIKDRLPTEAEEPIIQRYNPFAQPMMILSVSGDISLSDLTRISNDVIKKRLQKVDGVASATVSGGQEREILVEVDLGKMQSSNISLAGIVDSLKTSNVNYPAGTTQGRFYEYLVRTIGEYKDVKDIGNTIVAVDSAREAPEYLYRQQNQRKGADAFQPRLQRLVALNNIAEVKDSFIETESYSRHNRNPNISIAIQKQFDVNTIKAARRAKRALTELSQSLPKNMKVEIVYDESKFIQGSLFDVATDAVLGGILAFLVLLFFLRNIGDAFIVTLSLPISILVVFIFLYFMDRSINVIALAGLSLGIGSITDNAIAVLDNIVECRKENANPIEASIKGAADVAVAQFSSMLTNIVVFLPLLFAKGLAQQLFKDLFYAAVISNIAAFVVALTLIPRITAHPILSLKSKSDEPAGEDTEKNPKDDVFIGVGGTIHARNPGSQIAFYERQPFKKFKWLLEGLTVEKSDKLVHFYQKWLLWCIMNRKKVLFWAGSLFIISLMIFSFKSKIFMPTVDQGQFLIRLNMPIGTRLDETNRIMEKIEAILAKMPETKDLLARVGSSGEQSIDALRDHQGECTVTVNRNKTTLSTGEMILKVKEELKPLSLEGGETEFLLQDSSVKAMTGTSAPIAITVKGPDLGVLRKYSDDIQLAIKSIPGIEGVKTNLPLPSFETRVSIDKDRASAFGLSTSEIARTSLIGIHGFIATYYKEEGKEIGVRVRLREEDRNNPAALHKVAVRTQQMVMVPLGDVANITAGYGPSEIQRFDQQRAIVVSAQVFGRSLGDVIKDVDEKIKHFSGIKDYSLEIGGTKKEIQESFGGLVFAFILAVVLIYMIMAAGFESLLHPFLIMITVPLGVIGVAMILLVTFTPVSVPVMLGVVLLGGIVVNNGIVLIDHINFLRTAEKKEILEAVVLGCAHRLKPVLMTAIVTILSLVPIALGLGQGTEMSSPMAIATLGGLSISTVLTLVILPILYLMVEERKKKKTHHLMVEE